MITMLLIGPIMSKLTTLKECFAWITTPGKNSWG